jgi:preprotein translocase subunit SecA
MALAAAAGGAAEGYAAGPEGYGGPEGYPGEGYPADQPMPTPVEQRRVDQTQQVGRNDPCWCGSGKKFKKCHGA